MYFYIFKPFFSYTCRTGFSNISTMNIIQIKTTKSRYRWTVQRTSFTYSIYLYIMPILANLRPNRFFWFEFICNCQICQLNLTWNLVFQNAWFQWVWGGWVTLVLRSSHKHRVSSLINCRTEIETCLSPASSTEELK